MRGYGGRTRFGQRYYSGVFTAAVGQVKKSAEIKYAGMAELADAPDLGSVTTVEFLLRLSGRLKNGRKFNMRPWRNWQTRWI
ncbi:MAG: hypothetical protein K2N06_00280 [Oscillospiraceae bacterium]|nr:hypothetical protein [Oscillospiraceae bacterium]